MISCAVCCSSISSCFREKTAVCHPAERVIACQLLSTEQSPNARAKRRAGRIASDTAHPGNQLLEDLWEVELDQLHWLCLLLLQPLPHTCPPTQLALQPDLHLSTDCLNTNPTCWMIISVYPPKLVALPHFVGLSPFQKVKLHCWLFRMSGRLRIQSNLLHLFIFI